MIIDTFNVIGMSMPQPPTHPPAGCAVEDSTDDGCSRRALREVNAEFVRSQGTGWRRVLPSAFSDDYLPFLKHERKLNHLPFDITAAA